jgi:hypothetical protein
MQRISITYTCKWRVKFATHYLFTRCKKLINSRTGKEIKKVSKGSCIGYVIESKFISLTALKLYQLNINYHFENTPTAHSPSNPLLQPL